jgi:nicotinamidase/pyrazinamidase
MKAVIVVDMLRGFLEPGFALYGGAACRAILPATRAYLERERDAGSLLVFLADTHDPDDKEFQMFPPHCVRGTPEVEIIPELADLAVNAIVVPKRRYSGFFDTPLEVILRDRGVTEVVVVGVMTDICVLHTTADLRNRDYPTTVLSDCVASFDPEQHGFALHHIRAILGARVATSAELAAEAAQTKPGGAASSGGSGTATKS